MPSYDTCRDALQKSIRACGRPSLAPTYEGCVRELGIATQPHASVDCVSTQCVASGDTQPIHACVRDASSATQLVHGFSQFGGPSRVAPATAMATHSSKNP